MDKPKNPRFIDRAGHQYGRLTVVDYAGPAKGNNQRWLCKCECGNDKVVLGTALNSGHTKSCGCLNSEKVIERQHKHGLSNHYIYPIWSTMKARCYNKNNHKYYRYGERGIKVCDRWLNSVENFYFDMGERPSDKHSVGRIDNDGDYCPENCRWETPKQQVNNRAPHGKHKYFGVSERKCSRKKPFIVQDRIDGKNKQIGAYATLEEAVQAASLHFGYDV